MSELELRLSIVENKINQLEGTTSTHRDNFVRVDEQIKGLREQAKSYNDTAVTLNTEMNHKLDRLMAAVGADLEGASSAELRKDFAHLRSIRTSKEMTQDWVRKSLIGALITGMLFLLGMGALHYIKREIEAIDRGEHYGESSDRGSLSKPATNLPGVPATR